MIAFLLAALPLVAAPQENKPGDKAPQEKQEKTPAEKIVKERASLLRTAVKTYAIFVSADAAKGEVRLRPEGEGQPEKAWALDPEAEIRVRGWWGGLEDLVPGDRVWVWTRVDRAGKPKAIFMVADEISEQDIHQVPYTLASVDAGKREVVVRRNLDGKTETVRKLSRGESVALVKTEGEIYVRTSGHDLLETAGEDELAVMKEAQKKRLEERWRRSGLPGTVSSLHPFTGEAEVLLDHESMRWGRALKAGDLVKLTVDPPVQALVLDVRPWNERTRLSVAAVAREVADLRAGMRVRVAVPEPPAEALKSRLPADAGRPREAAARGEWFLASTYCSCSIAGDVCTGMFYTLASCNAMTCGMPNRVRGFVGPLIKKGLSDPEIFEQMEREFGTGIWKPHLLR